MTALARRSGAAKESPILPSPILSIGTSLNQRTRGLKSLRLVQEHWIMLDHCDCVIRCDQPCRWDVEWDLCAPVNHAANFHLFSDACLISEINWGKGSGSVSHAAWVIAGARCGSYNSMPGGLSVSASGCHCRKLNPASK
jgi:hypothetical protein